MHSYSIDTDRRPTIFLVIAVISMGIPTLWEFSQHLLQQYLSIPLKIGFPLTFSTLFGFQFFAFNYWGWKLSSSISGVTNLNGKWTGKGVSSFVDPDTGKPSEYLIDISIKQTYSSIEVYSETNSSTSRSIMASMVLNGAMPQFRYAYENTPKNLADPELQRHPGLMDLNIESKTKMTGGYFSGKHRLRYGQIEFTRKEGK